MRRSRLLSPLRSCSSFTKSWDCFSPSFYLSELSPRQSFLGSHFRYVSCQLSNCWPQFTLLAISYSTRSSRRTHNPGSIPDPENSLDPLYVDFRFVKKKQRLHQSDVLEKDLEILEQNQGTFPPHALQPILESSLVLNDKDLLKRTLNLLPRIRGGDVLQYTALLAFLGRVGLIDELFFVLDRMIEEGLQPTLYCLSKLVGSLEAFGKMDRAMELHAFSKKNNITFDVITYNSFIVGFGKRKQLEKAVEVLDIMLADKVDPDASTFFEMMNAAIRANQPQKCFEIYDGMKQYFGHLKPNLYIFTALINASIALKNVVLAEKYFDEMKKEGLQPDVFLYSSMLNAVSLERNPHKAWAVYENMKKDGIQPNSVTFGTLAKISRICDSEWLVRLIMQEHQVVNLKFSPTVYGNFVLFYINRGQPEQACQYVEEMAAEGMHVENSLLESLERVCANKPDLIARVQRVRNSKKKAS